MFRKTGKLAAAVVLAVLTAKPAGAQQCLPAPVGHCNPYEDNNGPLLCGDPLLDSPCWAPPGWFFGLEADLTGTHIKNRIVGQVGTDTIHLPTAELAWTVSPRIEVGYRCCEGAGELLFSYKFLVTTGTESQANFDSNGDPGNLHSRLNINAWDIDYACREYSLWPCCDMRWRAGVRLAGLFFDSAESSPLLQQHVANYFFGAGPHIGLDLRRFVMCTGFEFIGRIESAFLIGQSQQSYDEVVSAPGVGPVAANSHFEATQLVPWLNLQAGVGWTPPPCQQLTLSAGYTFECWWDLADVGNSRGDIMSQGVFFRAEWRY